VAVFVCEGRALQNFADNTSCAGYAPVMPTWAKFIRGGLWSLALLFASSIAHADPYTFWVNNNYDRTNYSSDDDGIVQDDLTQIQIAQLPAGQQEPDCNFRNAAGQRVIPCTRDLEDFARLWVGGVTPSLIAALPAGSTLTLSLAGVTANPSIDLFAAADPGIGFQTNETTALEQIDPAQCPYYGRISSTNPIVFTKSTWPSNQFIWCGCSYGAGALTLTIEDGNSNVLAQTPVYIQLVDIKQMYECWTVGDRPGFPPTNTPVLASDFIAPGAVPFQYTPPTVPTDYVLLVHGWNMNQWDKDRYAECAFKRLYWQGYQGRFGLFRWPTGNGITGLVSAALDTRNYDNSENQAWQSSVGLTNLLTQLNNEYPGRVYLMAHSMGNVVAGEALRRMNSQLVKIYVAMQGAVPAHCYDSSTPDHATYSPPDDYAHYWTSGAASYFNGSAGAGNYVNFFNTNDYALGWWLFNQSKKPDDSPLNYPGYFYSYSTSSSGFYKILGPATNQTIYLNFPTNTYEIFAYGDPAWSYALGAEAGITTFDRILDLQSIWPSDPYGLHDYGSHFWHSAEFRGDYPMQVNYWRRIMGTNGFQLK
jgi:hypothetical protein